MTAYSIGKSTPLNNAGELGNDPASIVDAKGLPKIIGRGLAAIDKAFFDVNAWVSVAFFVLVVADEAVRMLSDILGRMEKHHDKKRSLFRRLRVSTFGDRTVASADG